MSTADTPGLLREYLDSLVWDGMARLDRWLITYLGVADTAYARAVGPARSCPRSRGSYIPGRQGAMVRTR